MGQSRVLSFFHNLQTPSVSGFLHVPANPSGDTLILTHGAGADCQSALLVALATAFCESGLAVLRCDLPFRQLHRHGPPPRSSANQDQRGLRNAVWAMKRASGRIFLGGHSYGGRQATMLAAAEPGLVDGLLLLSYPLHRPRNRSSYEPHIFRTSDTGAVRARLTRHYGHDWRNAEGGESHPRSDGVSRYSGRRTRVGLRANVRRSVDDRGEGILEFRRFCKLRGND